MSMMDRISLFSPLDGLAVLIILSSWVAIGWRIENPSPDRPSVSNLMAQFRKDWMAQMVTRQPRIFDSSILSTLRQGTTFFASATMIAIGGGLALLGRMEELRGVARDLTQNDAPALVWEVKILLALLFLTNAFLKFVWSHRLFGYCAVMMGSVPNNPEDPLAYTRADMAASLNITAAKSYNRGLRSIYFAMAALAWLIGPAGLLLATGVTVLVLWRREFASHSRSVLIEGD
ncbi:DUF599 domain-containing protein [Aliiroseovarius sp. KMU-50]|uniref:DUF599 domain-containing protein n=1 Tax=Aliiroseovarius salicola TaxID=3009082 RepID=A0ABT4VZ72_9RHOB|nr:DUF599 domain-containing protein [Aliiroseovarius sp. KMU-50]MDA5093571.1 DUF599 domain-containing protein [Aliiroseovarius sp. KMU-50]